MTKQTEPNNTFPCFRYSCSNVRGVNTVCAASLSSWQLVQPNFQLCYLFLLQPLIPGSRKSAKEKHTAEALPPWNYFSSVKGNVLKPSTQLTPSLTQRFVKTYNPGILASTQNTNIYMSFSSQLGLFHAAANPPYP